MLWRLIKTAIFTMVAPGTVALYLPQSLRERSADAAVHSSVRLYPWLALFVCGAAIYLWCAWDFALKGLYRFTRNPMYVGVAAMIAAQAGYYRSRSLAPYLLVVLFAFHAFVRLYEEPALRRLFGAQYERYCRTVPRWLPRLPHE